MASTGSTGSTRFGELLRRHRHAAGLTQPELAERAGLSVRGINDLERGVRQTPRKDTVTLLAQALGLSEEERTAFAAAARRGAGAAASAVSTASPPARDVGQLTAPAVALPSGTVTFLFTDIEGSTHLLQRLGAARYGQALASVRRLLHAACTQHKGRAVDATGDSSFFAFAQAPDALAAAAQAQRALAAHAWQDEATVRIRMGLHTGTAQVVGDHYIGLDVHRAARIAVAGHGGQVLLSWATCVLVESEISEGTALRDLGEHRLKDLRRAERLFQVILPDLHSEFPPPNSLDAHLHNLPVQLTSFVGRERELAKLEPLVLSSHLLTLSGPGGIGKTRLALRLAADVLETFPGGVWLVELAPLGDPALLSHTVAAALGVQDQPGRPILDVLRDYLRAKSLLLILDNCEHLIDACAHLVETLLRAAPSLRILASSREALGIAGETVYRVPSLPLPLPDRGQPRNLDALARNDCARLFVERAAATHPAFGLTTTNAPAIAEIGRRLDGIPLAIELAAACIKVLPPEQIVVGLDDRFRLLTGGRRTALPRHQTLLALIEWSHDLLSEPERVLLRRLSVFAGGWSLDAAQVVCGDGLDAEVLETLAHLVDKSLVDVEEPSTAIEGRYRLLETIRQYARAKLLASGEADWVRDRHVGYFIHFAEEAEPHLRRAEQLAWLDSVEREHDNLRTALGWALESGKSDRALELAGALSYFWLTRGNFGEGYKWLHEALVLSEREQSKNLAAGNHMPTPSEKAHRAKALDGVAWAQFGTLGVKEAQAAVEEGLRLWRELGDTWWTAVELEHEALILALEGDFQTALVRLEEGVALARQLEDPWPLATCLIRIGDALKPRGEAVAARPFLEEGVALARTIGDKLLLSEGLRELGSLYFAVGDLTAAASLTAEALANGRAIGSMSHEFLGLYQLVIIACLQSDPAKAHGHSVELWALGKETGAPFAAAFVLFSFGLAACFGGEPGKGVRLLAVAEKVLRQVGIDVLSAEADPTTKVYQQAMEKARARLGTAAFDLAWVEGQHLTPEQALALATEGESTADATAEEESAAVIATEHGEMS
jgi:predicted ATPase/class 3 adenylate cyclase